MGTVLNKSEHTTILALSWRDIKAPQAGGAEIYTHEILRRAAAHGMRIIHFSPLYYGGVGDELIDEVRYIRKGGIFSVIWHAFRFYRINRSKIDFVIDQCNTHRFFTKFWVNQNKRIFLIFQLTCEIWDYVMPPPWNWIGKHLEKSMLKLSKNDVTITESKSTQSELIQVGYKRELIHLIPVGLNSAVMFLSELTAKQVHPTFIYVGRYAKYKGIDNSITAFGIVKKLYPLAKLWIVGKVDETYLRGTLFSISNECGLTIGESESCDVIIKGFVSEEEKMKLQSQSHALLFPSIREGWGMIVSEAAAVGTPSIVFNSPGCRDAVDYGRAGYLCRENTDEELARLMISTQRDIERYNKIRTDAYHFSTQLRWDASASRFISLVEFLVEKK